MLCVSSVMSDSFVTTWTIDCQAPLSMEFSRQEYWSGLPFPTLKILGIFSTQGSNPHLLHSLPWWILYHCITWETLQVNVPCRYTSIQGCAKCQMTNASSKTNGKAEQRIFILGSMIRRVL